MSLSLEQLADLEEVAARAAAKAAKEAAREAVREVTMSSDDIKKLVADTVRQTLVQIGIDNASPIEMQQDFQHLRAWRKSGQELKTKGLVALLGIFLSGVATLVVLGVISWFQHSPRP